MSLRRLLVVVAVSAAVAGGAALFLLRDPWAAYDRPTAFVMTEMRIVSAEDGREIDRTAAGEDFLIAAAIELFDQVERELDRGYATVDPAAERITLYLAGQVDSAPVPARGGTSRLESSDAGGAETLIERDRFGPGFTLIARGGGFAETIAGHARFVPAPDDAADRRATQATLQEAAAAALAAWQAENDEVAALLESPAPPSGDTYETRTPGGQHRLTLPLSWRLGVFSQADEYRLISTSDPETEVTLRLVPAARAGGMFVADRERRLSAAPGEALIVDDGMRLLHSRQGRPYYYLEHVPVGDLAYFVWVETDEPEIIRTASAIAASIADGALQAPDWFGTGMDLRTRLAERGLTVIPHDFDVTGLTEGFAKLVEPESLMETWAGARFLTLQMKLNDAADPGFPIWEVDAACTVTQADGGDMTGAHDLLDDPFALEPFEGRASRPDFRQYVASGQFAAEADFTPEPFAESGAGELRWLSVGDDVALAADDIVYYLYARRSLGPVDLVCGFSGPDAVRVTLAHQLAANIPLPSLDSLPPEALALFRSKYMVSKLAPGLYSFDEEDGGDGVMTAMGETIIAPDYAWITWHQAGAISAETKDDLTGLWAPDGEVLLEPAYEDIRDADDEGEGILALWRDGERLLYSVPERRFVEPE